MLNRLVMLRFCRIRSDSLCLVVILHYWLKGLNGAARLLAAKDLAALPDSLLR